MAARFIGISSILVIAAAGAAFAQPALGDGAAGGSAAGAGGPASPQPAVGARAAAPAQPALAPPGAAPSRPVVTGGGESDADEPNGPFLAGSLGLSQGPFAMADLQLGWRIGARFSPFVSLGAFVVPDAASLTHLTGGGARLWFDKVFLEGRVLRASFTPECDLDAPCADHTRYLGMFGIGGVLGGRHVGLEARVEVVDDGRDAVLLGTLGLGFYL